MEGARPEDGSLGDFPVKGDNQRTAQEGGRLHAEAGAASAEGGSEGCHGLLTLHISQRGDDLWERALPSLN